MTGVAGDGGRRGHTREQVWTPTELQPGPALPGLLACPPCGHRRPHPSPLALGDEDKESGVRITFVTGMGVIIAIIIFMKLLSQKENVIFLILQGEFKHLLPSSTPFFPELKGKSPNRAEKKSLIDTAGGRPARSRVPPPKSRPSVGGATRRGPGRPLPKPRRAGQNTGLGLAHQPPHASASPVGARGEVGALTVASRAGWEDGSVQQTDRPARAHSQM